MKATLPYDYEYWNSLTDAQWAVFKENEEMARNSRLTFSDDEWAKTFPLEIRTICDQKLPEYAGSLHRLATEKKLHFQESDESALEEDIDAMFERTLYEAGLDCTRFSLEKRQNYFLRLRAKTFPSDLIRKKSGSWVSDEEIQIAKAVSVTSLLDTTKQSGNRRVARCIFHREQTPSFFIYPDGDWHCFGCAKHGTDSIGFVMLRDSKTFPEAVKMLNQLVS